MEHRVKSQRIEVRGQLAEGRGQRTEDRGQKSEGSWQRAEVAPDGEVIRYSDFFRELFVSVNIQSYGI